MRGASATGLPWMCKSNTTTPAISNTPSCRMATATRGTDLPATISSELARLARMRSQVAQPCSEKNEKVTSDTTKNADITACPGTTCSAPLAWTNPFSTSAGRNAGFRKAVVMMGEHEQHEDREGIATRDARLVRDDHTEPPQRVHAADSTSFP